MKFVLTGIARSGTTIVCKFLHSIPDVVCLSEPHIEFKRRGWIRAFTDDPRLAGLGLRFTPDSPLPMDHAVTHTFEVAGRVGFKEVLLPEAIFPGVDYHTDALIERYLDAGYRLLVVVRDPIGNYNSLKRMRWGNMSRLDMMVRNYQFLEERLLPRAHGLVVYERFRTDPNAEIQRIPGFEGCGTIQKLRHLPLVQGDLKAAGAEEVNERTGSPNEVTEEEEKRLVLSEAHRIYVEATNWRPR